MAVYVFVVCMYVSVWCGSSLSRGWWQFGDTAEQRARIMSQPATADMLRNWRKPSQVRAEAAFVDILVHPTYPASLYHHAL